MLAMCCSSPRALTRTYAMDVIVSLLRGTRGRAAVRLGNGSPQARHVCEYLGAPPLSPLPVHLGNMGTGHGGGTAIHCSLGGVLGFEALFARERMSRISCDPRPHRAPSILPSR